jgi:hypothetical protein
MAFCFSSKLVKLFVVALSLLSSVTVGVEVEGERASQSAGLEASVAANVKVMGDYAELASDVLSRIMVSEVGLRVEFTVEVRAINIHLKFYRLSISSSTFMLIFAYSLF